MKVYGYYLTPFTDMLIPRVEDTADAVSLVADRYVGGDDSFEVEPGFCTLCAYDRKTKELSGREYLEYWFCYLRMKQWSIHEDKNHPINKSFVAMTNNWSSVSTTLEQKSVEQLMNGDFCIKVMMHFLQRIIQLRCPQIMQKAGTFTLGAFLALATNFDDLDAIDSLMQLTDASTVREHLENRTLALSQAKKMKNKVGIPVDIMQEITRLNLGSELHVVQHLFEEKRISADDFRRLISFFDSVDAICETKKLFSQRKRDVEHCQFERLDYKKKCLALLAVGFSVKDVTDMISRELLMFNDRFWNRDEGDQSVYDAFRKIADVVRTMRDVANMLTQSSRDPVLEQNLSLWHAIVARNLRAETEEIPGYEEAAKELNQDSCVVGDYLIKCPETVKELVDGGFAHKNCLPTYARLIAEKKAKIYGLYKVGSDEFPDVVFEIGDNMEYIQIKTYFDQDVTDPAIIDILNQWRAGVKRKEGKNNG